MKNSQIHVLIVDDDQPLLKSVESLFASLGFNVQTASSGKAALEIIKKNKIQVVLSDIRMQDGDGWYLAKMVRALPNHPKILFITGYSEHTVEQVFHEGIDGFFEKPFDASAVKNAILRTCVSPVARWAALPSGEAQGTVTFSAKTQAELGEKQGLFFGRGGFCFNHSSPHFGDGTPLNFEITLTSQAPFARLKGMGVIKWRHSRQGRKDAGYGLEIEYLEGDGPQAYHKIFGKETAWIPSMNLLASQSA